ncbi:hypothetical protein ACVWYD_003125 [Morganella morganii]|nr:hypothetical protein [Morganella morganii]
MNRKEAVIAVLFIAAVWWVYDIYWDNQQLKVNNTRLSGQLSVQQVINATTLSAIATNHRVSLDNIKAKQTEGTEHVKVKTVIKTVFKGSECAVIPVPADAVSELRRYATGINTRTGDTDSATTDR